MLGGWSSPSESRRRIWATDGARQKELEPLQKSGQVRLSLPVGFSPHPFVERPREAQSKQCHR
jgi:hypothetical protein